MIIFSKHSLSPYYMCQTLYSVLLILSLVWGTGVLARDLMEGLVWKLLPPTTDPYGLLPCYPATSSSVDTPQTRNRVAGTRAEQDVVQAAHRLFSILSLLSILL